MILLVKITQCGNITDEDKPYIMLAGVLVKPINTNIDGGDLEYETSTWYYNTDELQPEHPSLYKNKKLGLIPYPHGTTPYVIADGCTTAEVLHGPLYFFFTFYNAQIDLSGMADKAYSVIVIE